MHECKREYSGDGSSDAEYKPNSGITFLAQIVNDTFFCMIQYVFALNGVLIFLHIDPLHVTTLIKMNNVIENHI